MNIYMMTDLEGSCYASSFDQVLPKHPLYPFLTRVLTEEVNTAVEALLQQGVEKIYVVDGHGAGGINLEYLHRRAHLITGRPFALPWGIDADDFSAVFIIGQHAAAGFGGILSHTQSQEGVQEWRLNSRIIGEIGTMALLAGHFDLPVVFLSGTDTAGKELREINPQAVTVTTKRGICDTFGVYYPLEEVLKQIRDGTKKGLQAIMRSKPFKPEPPLELIIKNTQVGKASIALLARKPEAKLIDETTVKITAPNVLSLLKTVFE